MGSGLPKRALQFLRWFCREDCIEEIEGNLLEIFTKECVHSSAKARRSFTWSVIRHFRPRFIKPPASIHVVNITDMIQHNILIAFRNFRRYKSSFFINLSGLTAGLTSVLLIYLWVQSELSVDKFHEKDNRLFQVMRNTPGPSNNIDTHSSNSVLLPPALEAEMPEIEFVVPMRSTPPSIVTAGKQSVKATGVFAGKDFFQVFTFPLVQGTPSTALLEKYSTVISDELARKLFGSVENSIGKTITWDLNHFGGDHIVSAVFHKPKNSSDAFDFLVTYERFLEKNQMDVNWDSNPIIINLTLKPDVDAASFGNKLNKFYQSKRSVDSNLTADAMFLKRYSDLYLHGRYENGKVAGGRIDYVILFSAIGIFILAIACINFMNLSTARATRRWKEVGVKKTMGAMRSTLIIQHLSEAMVMSFTSFLFALTLVFLLLPQFNLLTGKNLDLTDWTPLAGASIIVLITGFISGSYPAFYLSGFKPAEIMKGRLTSSVAETLIRKGLVVFQFSISILLIVGVAIVYRQMDFVQSKNLGYAKENVIQLERQGKLNAQLETFLSELKTIPEVVNASSTGQSITNNENSSWGHTWEGQLPGGENLDFSGTVINYNFIETMGMKVIAGRSFSQAQHDDESKIMLNETAINKMEMKNPVGKWIELWGMKREIIGVVKDYHFQSMYADIRPMFLMVNQQYTNTIAVRITAGSERNAIPKLAALYNKFNPGLPFEFRFLDDDYNLLYASEARVSKLAKYFAIIAILLSCLGLFGLASFSAERRTKEISIRKILGCGELTIVRMLTTDFTTMVLIAIVLTLPVAYILSTKWLSSFAYRADMPWWIFAGSGFATLIIAWTTVAVQTVKVAKTNPVSSLKSE